MEPVLRFRTWSASKANPTFKSYKGPGFGSFSWAWIGATNLFSNIRQEPVPGTFRVRKAFYQAIDIRNHQVAGDARCGDADCAVLPPPGSVVSLLTWPSAFSYDPDGARSCWPMRAIERL